MSTLQVGILGLSHLHPRAYMVLFESMPGMKVVAAAESDDAVRHSFAKDFPVRTYASWQQMLEQEKLDIAVLFLPHAHCPEAAVACAARGIHLIVEKPMAADAAGVRRMIDASNKTGVLLTVPYVWRYHPVARAMKKLIDEGAMGRIVGCEGRCAAGRLHRYINGNSGWMLTRALSGGGPMWNLGVHWIDLYRWLLDDEVVDVTGRNVKVNTEYDIEDNSFALVTFSKGTVLSLDISYTVPDAYPAGRDLYLGLRGTAGAMNWSPSFEGVKESLFVCTEEARNVNFDLTPHPGYGSPMTRPFLEEFEQAVRTGGQPFITGEDGCKALEVVEAIYRSASKETVR